LNDLLIGFILALIAAISWGSASAMYKNILKIDQSLLLTLTIRGLFAVPLVGMVTLLINGFKSVPILLSVDILPILVLSSIFVALGDFFYFGSLQRIEVSKAAPVSAIYPLFTSILLVISGLEEISGAVIAGIIILVVGIGLVTQENRLQSLESSKNEVQKNSSLGIGIAVLAAFFWSLAILTVRIILDNPKIDVFSLVTIRFGLLTLIVGILWLFSLTINYRGRVQKETPITSLSKNQAFVLGLGGIMSWGIGAIAFFSSIEIIGAAKATPISSINPLISVFLGILILKEKLTSVQIIGIILVCFGSIFISAF